MQSSSLTLESLKQLLNAIRKGDAISPDWPGWEQFAIERQARPVDVKEYLCSLAVAELNAQHKRESLPLVQPDAISTRHEMLRALERDFLVDNTRLQAWSALYYRYLAPVTFSVETLAESAHVDRRQFYRRVQEGLVLFAEVLCRQRAALPRKNLRAYLPPRDYTRLFGVDEHVRTLTNLLTDGCGPALVSLEGLGGIGKTALAQSVAETLSSHQHFAGVYWISARQNWLDLGGVLHSAVDPAFSLYDIISRLSVQLGIEQVDGLSAEEKIAHLKPALDDAPALVVVDNLETVEEADALLPVLNRLAQPTRFLLTTRHSVARFPYVWRFPVPELSFENARALFANELGRRGRTLAVDTVPFEKVYALVGGLPLALKLTAAQVSHLPLSLVLENLARGKGQGQEALYTYIYRRIWMMLDDAARSLLLSTLLISPDGEDARWLQEMSALPERDFSAALEQLQEYSLLEVTGSLEAPVFHLHRLTSAFLRSEILQQWNGDSA